MTQKEYAKWAETLARDLLVSKGLAIRETNWRMGHYEIDIIAMHGNQIVFVEVKARRAPSYDPVQAVNRGKRTRTIASADTYLKLFEIPFEYRFDIISIVGDDKKYTIEHIPDAYMPAVRRINYSFRL